MRLYKPSAVFISIVCLAGCAARKHSQASAFMHEPSQWVRESLPVPMTHPALDDPQPPSPPARQAAQAPPAMPVIPPSEIAPLPEPPVLSPPETEPAPPLIIAPQIAALPPPPPAQAESPKPEPAIGRQKISLGLLALAPVCLIGLWLIGTSLAKPGKKFI